MENEEFDIDSFIKENEERDARWKQMEEDAKKDIVKYFDRIHDNLFTYNNLLIGAFFALGQLQVSVSKWTIIIPVVNLWFLIYVDWRMMEKARYESSIMSQPFDTFDGMAKKLQNTNLLSFASIVTTLLVTFAFLYYLKI
jgi:hypothetical protein